MKACLGKSLYEDAKGNIKTDETIINLYKKYYEEKNSRFNDVSSLTSLDFLAFRYDDMILASDYGNKSPYNTPSSYFIHNDNIQKTISNVTGDADAVIINGIKWYPYVPGLSDSLMKNSSYPVDEISKKTAGTDCNGLVQRSFAYENADESVSFYSALDTAGRRAPVYWNSTSIPESKMSRFFNRTSLKAGGTDGKGTGNTAVRICKDDKPTVIINENGDDLKAYKDLENVVPGDVIGYLGSDGTYFSHIMMIADVAAPTGYDVNGKPYWKDGSGIKIIESVYHDGDKCWGVANKRTVEMINNRTWSIWRQK